MSRPRLLLAGLGRMGNHHLKAIGRTDRFELLGLCDLQPRHAPPDGLPSWTSLQEALDSARPEAAILALPPHAHEEAARRCLDAGVSVLLEKPLTPHHATSRTLVEAFSRHGLVLLPGLSERYHPVWLAAQPLVPEIGPLRSVTIARHSPGARPEHGIDVALDLGIHDLDLLASLVPALTVRALHRTVSELRMRLEVPGGPEVALEARWNASIAHRRWRLEGTRGSLDLDLLEGTLHRDGRSRPVARGDALEAQLEHFSRCLEKRAAPGTETALKAQEWLDYPTNATASISTFTSRGRRPTSMVERAGA